MGRTVPRGASGRQPERLELAASSEFVQNVRMATRAGVRTLLGAVWLCGLSMGCDKPAEPVATKPAEVPAAAPAGQPVPVRPPLPAIAEQDVKALLERWTVAQNEGDFAVYEPLYAPRFLGIKRAGERTTQFTRESWLRDRKAMFKKPMQVQALDPVIHAAAGAAEVTFTQRWSSGAYSDVGPKRLLLVREGGELRIAHEEMLHSQQLGAKARAGSLDFRFTVATRDGLYLVLSELTAPEAHGEVSLAHELEADSQLFTSVAPVDEGALPAEASAWTQRKLRLDDGCQAEVDGFVLLSRVEPHFGTVQTWQGVGDLPGPALDEAQTAREAFALAGTQLAARLRGCSQGAFAQRVETPAPISAIELTDEPLLARGRAAFVALPTVQALQRRHRKEAEDPSGVWWQQSLKAEAFRHPSSGQVLISVQADNGGTCADFSAADWALFEARGDRLVRLRDELTPARVVRALDVDGDGRLELLVEHPDLSTDRVLVSPDQAWSEPRLVRSYQDCPC